MNARDRKQFAICGGLKLAFYEYGSSGWTICSSTTKIGSVISGNSRHGTTRPSIDMAAFDWNSRSRSACRSGDKPFDVSPVLSSALV